MDIGSEFIYVCVPTDSSPTPVARFGTFTADLLEMADWLAECHVESLAMESTGVYWIPVFEILESRGFSVTLVSPNYPKKPHKSDVEDCQWLQYLHAVGLLKGSFRPPDTVCAVRAILRHRSTLVSEASVYIQRMQKALTQMNLLLHNVISDITGTTGLAIIDSILSGQRDPKLLSAFRDRRIKATEEEIAKSLVGNYRREHLFTLKQAREAYQFFQNQIAQCDEQIEQMLSEFDGEYPDPPTDAGKYRHTTGKNDIQLARTDLHTEMVRINGVDLASVPGIGPNTAAVIFTELGTDLSAFPSFKHFTSWLKLSPDPNMSGGTVVGKGKGRSKSRIGQCLRQAALSLARNDTYLGHYYRRMRAKFGPKIAVKATANKLARIIYALLTTKQSYDETIFIKAQEQYREKKIQYILKEATKLGLQFVPA